MLTIFFESFLTVDCTCLGGLTVDCRLSVVADVSIECMGVTLP